LNRAIPPDLRRELDRPRHEIREHDHAYYVLARPTVSDATYDALMRRVRRSPIEEIRLTSIRSPSYLPTPMHIPEWFDNLFFHDETEDHKKRFKPTPTERKRRRAALATMPENMEGARRLGLNRVPKLPTNDKRVLTIQRWIKKRDLPDTHCIPEIYQSVGIIDITQRTAKDRRHPYYIVRTDSMFCMNKGAEHNHCGVYFLITTKGLCQKCWCRCPTTEGRKSGKPCCKWRSAYKQMPFSVRKALYPKLHNQYSEVSPYINGDMRNVQGKQRKLLLELKLQELDARWDRMHQRGKERYEKQFRSKRGDLK